jgi:hypothetical protein
MTRDEIAGELMALVVEIGNTCGSVDGDPVATARRAYIRGLAGHAILELRDRLLGVERGASARTLIDEFPLAARQDEPR